MRPAANPTEKRYRSTQTLSRCLPLGIRSANCLTSARNCRAIEAQQFLADVRQLAERMPSGKHLLNVCVDRYRFSVGFAAGLMSDKVNLLPSTHAPEFVRQLAQFAPDAVCLTDEERCDIDLPRFQYHRDLG